MLRRSEREELGDLKGSSTERAIAARDGGVSKQPFDLTLSVFQEFAAGDTRWEGVGILGVNLHQNDETGAEVAKQGISNVPGVCLSGWLDLLDILCAIGIHQEIDRITKRYMCAHEDGVGNYGLRLGGSGGGVVVI